MGSKLIKSGLKTLLALILIFGISGLAQAETMVVNPWHSGYQVYLSHNDGDVRSVSTVEFDLLVDNMEKVGFCVDLAQTIGQATYEVTTIQPNSLEFLEAAWLMQTYAPGLTMANPDYGLSSVRTVITALQIAIWEVTYDNSAKDLYDGGFKLGTYVDGDGISHTNNAAAVALATQYLSNIPDGLNLGMFNGYGIAASETNQDLIYGSTPGGETPEPASMLLFASALGAGGWIRRRQSKKKQA